MKKNLTVVRSSRVVVDDKKDNYCTLASIGEFPKEYSLVKSFKDDGDEKSVKDKEEAKNSALSKLQALGLTEAEAKAIAGV
jgi:predicted DNA binding protein